jgi:uncharacterized Rossmann fold enzyme
MLGGSGGEALGALRAYKSPEAAVLCGGGDSLASDLQSVSSEDYIVTADGATSLLLEMGFLPELVVTDLDGVVDDQVKANAEGTVVFVHAHGDNREALERWVPEFRGSVVGTCQCEPVDGVFNFGGFTDGDRAACILAELGVRSILLAGFDLERPARKPGRPAAVKARKLRWADRILAMMADEGVSVEMLSTR